MRVQATSVRIEISEKEALEIRNALVEKVNELRFQDAEVRRNCEAGITLFGLLERSFSTTIFREGATHQPKEARDAK